MTPQPHASKLFVAAMALVAASSIARADSKAADAWQISGQIVDAEGKPVADVDVGAFWSGNGIPRDDDGTPWPKDEASFNKRVAGDGWKKMWRQIGVMEPFFRSKHARTDRRGRFSLEVSGDSEAILALDPERRRGCRALVDRAHRELAEPLVLEKLVKVHGRMTCASKEAMPSWTNVYLGFEPDPKRRPLDYFRVANCSSLTGEFALSVPPGKYHLEIYGTEPEAEIKEGMTLNVSGDAGEIDLGNLELQPGAFTLASRIREWEAKGGRGDFRRHFGRKPPAWHIADARGVKKDVQLTDYLGKWVVLEFWNLSCTPCLKRDLPDWAAFYRAHDGQRDRFEILAICVDVDENLDTIAQVDEKLKPIVKYVWGRPLPFPMLLDSRLATWQSFGLDYMAKTLLVDPDGNLTDISGHKEVRDHLEKQLGR